VPLVDPVASVTSPSATWVAANNAGPTQDTQSFLYTLDNTPAMDFLLP